MLRSISYTYDIHFGSLNILWKFEIFLQAFGVPDDRMGEELAVWVKLNDGHQLTEEDVKRFCKGKVKVFNSIDSLPELIFFY